MAYYDQSENKMPNERSLLMSFSVRQFEPDDKMCQHIVLHLFNHIVPPETIEQVLTRCHAWEKREKALNMRTIMSVVIALTLFPRLTVAGVLRQLAAGVRLLWPDHHVPLPTEGALALRRQQLGVTPVRHLFRACCRPLATKETKGAFRLGRRVVALDGTCEDVADVPKNANHFGRINSGPSSSPFPQLRGLYLVECATHAIFDAVFAPSRIGEMRLVRPLLRSIEANMLVLMDRAIFAGWLFEAISQRGADALAGLEQGMLTKPLYRLRDGSYIAQLSPKTARGLQKPLRLRVISYRLSAPGLPCDGEERRLVTTLLDPKEAPATLLIMLYHERWEIELTIDEHKTHLRLAQQPLRSRLPETVYQEAYGMLLLHYGLRALMHQAALQADVDPRRISFSFTVEHVQRAVYEASLIVPEQQEALRFRLLRDLAAHPLPKRRLRFNARVVKRPLSSFRRKHFWHLEGLHLQGSSFLELILLI